MKVYVQRVDGTEIELEVGQPDPKDGTYIAYMPAVGLQLDEDDWIRIVPEE